MNKWMLIGIALTVTLAAPSVQADILATDGFESYSTGNLDDGSGVPYGGTGWNGSWAVYSNWRSNIQVVDRAMSYSNGSINVSGGSQALLLSPLSESAVLLRRVRQRQVERSRAGRPAVEVRVDPVDLGEV